MKERGRPKLCGQFSGSIIRKVVTSLTFSTNAELSVEVCNCKAWIICIHSVHSVCRLPCFFSVTENSRCMWRWMFVLYSIFISPHWAKIKVQVDEHCWCQSVLLLSAELYEYCLRENIADKNLIAKWKKPGYENVCCLRCIQKQDTNFGTNCICRVPKTKLEEVCSVSACCHLDWCLK